jgi:hypothetical protein
MIIQNFRQNRKVGRVTMLSVDHNLADIVEFRYNLVFRTNGAPLQARNFTSPKPVPQQVMRTLAVVD